MARPPKAQEAIDKDELEKLMKLYPTVREAADWFGVSDSSLERFVKANFDMSFDALRDKSFVKTRIAIKRAQIDKALKGDNVMLIWCGKQYLGQRDVQAVQLSNDGDKGIKIIVEDYTKK
jgi:hypothetical protein